MCRSLFLNKVAGQTPKILIDRCRRKREILECCFSWMKSKWFDCFLKNLFHIQALFLRTFSFFKTLSASDRRGKSFFGYFWSIIFLGTEWFYTVNNKLKTKFSVFPISLYVRLTRKIWEIMPTNRCVYSPNRKKYRTDSTVSEIYRTIPLVNKEAVAQTFQSKIFQGPKLTERVNVVLIL